MIQIFNISGCPFCSPDDSRIILSNNHAIAIYDNYPVTPGHTLIVPKRHMASFFEATQKEHAAMLDLLAEMEHGAGIRLVKLQSLQI